MVTSIILTMIASPLRPRAFLAEHDARARPLAMLAALAAGTAASAALLVPFMRATVEAAPMTPIDPAIVTKLIWITAAGMAPLGAVLTTIVVALLIWSVPACAGYETQWRASLVVATLGAAAGILQRVFVAGVLWLREWTDLADMRYDVRTGLDAFIGDSSPLVNAVIRHTGVFDIWGVVLVVVGLTTLGRLPRRMAIVTALAASLVVNGVLVMLEALR